MNGQTFFLALSILLIPLAIWDLVWKGLALWHAALNRQNKWFVALMLINSLGILPIIYLQFFQASKKKLIKVSSKASIGIIIAIAAVALVLLIAAVRFGLGGDEDTWLCRNGVWTQHGHPSATMPQTTCPR